MRRLMILRHAKAVTAGPALNDSARPLSPRGVKDAALMGAFLKRHAMVPDAVICSPALRTRETWAALAAAWSPSPPISFDEAIYQAGTRHLLEVVRGADPKTSSLMVIGHNPGLHELAMHFTASGELPDRERLSADFPTTALAVIEFAVEEWDAVHAQGGRLHRFVTPKLIETPVD